MKIIQSKQIFVKTGNILKIIYQIFYKNFLKFSNVF